MSNGTTAVPVSPIAQIMQELQQGEAAKARVPELEAEVARLTSALNQAQTHSQRLEENIIGYKDTIRAANERIRSLEVERDDYGFRQMETQDRLDALVAGVRAIASTVAEADHALNQAASRAKPEPVAPLPPAAPSSTPAPSQVAGAAIAEPEALASGPAEAQGQGNTSEGQSAERPMNVPYSGDASTQSSAEQTVGANMPDTYRPFDPAPTSAPNTAAPASGPLPNAGTQTAENQEPASAGSLSPMPWLR